MLFDEIRWGVREINVRRIGLLTTLWTALLFFPSSSVSLGLGEIEVSTFLNQPLKAEIEVLSARPGEIDDLLVSLASREAFDKAGLERPADLSKLRFKVEKSEDGQSARVLVSTKTPVKEPFLNFLVEADWAKGRLLREFTILLDPPHFAQQAAPVAQAQAPVAEPEPTQAPEPRASGKIAPRPLAEVIEPEADAASQPIAMSGSNTARQRESSYTADTGYAAGGPDTITVGKGDTLWSIASQFKDDAHSMGQVMLAMQAMNPDAFGNDNINNLKVGSVLRAPDQASLDRLSKQQAYAQVLEQNGLWDDYLARKSGNATSGSPVSTDIAGGSDKSSAGSKLSLMAPGDSDSTSASFQSGVNSQDAGQIRKQLALAEEELEAARLQNKDLQSRISDLEMQLEKFGELQDKLIQIEDTTLAARQGASAGDELPSESVGGMTEMLEQEQVVPSEIMVKSAEDMMKEEQAEPAQEAIAGMQEQEPVSTDSMTGPAMPSDEPMTSAEMSQEQAASDVIMEEPSEQPESSKDDFIPAPVIVTEAPSSATDDGILGMFPSMGALLADPIILGGLGGIVVLLLLLLFLKRKKSESKNDEATGITVEEGDGPELAVDDDATPIHVPTEEVADSSGDEATLGDTAIIEPAGDDGKGADEDEDPFGSTAILSADDMSQTEEHPAEEEQDDVLNEIDVYLAYGLYDNAEDLLKESLENSPDRADYRAKLLDTYFATKNADNFVKEAEALKSLGGAADRYWDRVQIMGYELDPGNALFAGAKDSGLSAADLEYAKPETADFDIGADEEGLDLTGTDIDFGVDGDVDDFDAVATQIMGESSASDGAKASDADDLMGDFDLPDLDDVDLDLGGEAGNKSDDSELLDGIDELDLGQPATPESTESTDALTFDLPDDLDLSATDDDINAAAADGADALDFDTTGELDVDLEIGETSDAEPEELQAEPELGDALIESEEEEISIDGAVEAEAIDMDISLEEAAEPQIGDASLAIEEDDEEQIDIALDGQAQDEEADVVDAEEAESDETMMLEADLEDAIDLSDDDLAIAMDEEAAEIQMQPDANQTDFEISADGEVVEVDEDDDQVEFEAPDDGSAEISLQSSLDDQVSEESEGEITDDVFNMEDVSEIDIDMEAFGATGEIPAFDVATDDVSNEVDIASGLEKTGTFAPGDFSDEEEIPEEERTYSGVTDVDDIEDLMLPDDIDEVSTKLDLARAFIDMGDAEGARSSLEEVLEEGNDEQKAEAQELLNQMN